MPNRLVREAWVESEAVDKLTAEAERFFLRLCLKADDFGRFHAHIQLLKSHLFPLRETLRSTDITAWLAECEATGVVRCYEVAGKPYLLIPKFRQRNRSQGSKFPEPPWPADDGHLSVTRQTSAHVGVGVGVNVGGAEGEVGVGVGDAKKHVHYKLHAKAGSEKETEILQKALDLMGAKILGLHGGLIRLRGREDPAKSHRVLNDIRSMQKEGYKASKGWMHVYNDLWNRFQ